MLKFVENMKKNSRKALLSQIDKLKARCSLFEGSLDIAVRQKQDAEKRLADFTAKAKADAEAAHKWDLENGRTQVLNMYMKMARMSLEQLREATSNFDVYEVTPDEFVFDEDNEPRAAEQTAEPTTTNKWAVVTAYCQLGGCDITTEFNNEYAARLYAVIMTELGEKPETTTCGPCYLEYMQECM